MNSTPSKAPRRRLLAGSSLIVTVALAGCVLFPNFERHRSSSVVSFLFPKEQSVAVQPGMPVLRLPLRVGIAFVPDERGGKNRFSEARKQVLLKRAAEEFRSLSFVESIQTVPELYLRPGGGFTNLDQLRGLLGIDVIALLSYDQTQFTDQNRYAIAYWTIVGAYLVNGNQNDTHTLMEATVYDIPSRTLLFHAPGADLTRASSSLAGAEREMYDDSVGSLDRATGDLVKNLHTELTAFCDTVKDGKTEVAIEHRPGYYAGGGAWDPTTLFGACALLAGAAFAVRRTDRRKPSEPSCNR